MPKIIETFNKLNDQTRYAILGGVVFVIVLLDVVFLVLPQISSIADISAQTKKLTDDTQEVLLDKQRFNLLKKNLHEARLQLGSLSHKVRSFQEVSAILTTVSSIAKESGVKIDQLVPEYAQQVMLTSSADGKYYALPVVIKASCGYHMFGHFLNKLEKEDLYFILKNFIIENDVQDPATHSFSLTINMVLLNRS